MMGRREMCQRMGKVINNSDKSVEGKQMSWSSCFFRDGVVVGGLCDGWGVVHMMWCCVHLDCAVDWSPQWKQDWQTLRGQQANGRHDSMNVSGKNFSQWNSKCSRSTALCSCSCWIDEFESKSYLYASFVSCHLLGNNGIGNPALQVNCTPLLRNVQQDCGKRSREQLELGTTFKGHFACYE